MQAMHIESCNDLDKMCVFLIANIVHAATAVLARSWLKALQRAPLCIMRRLSHLIAQASSSNGGVVTYCTMVSSCITGENVDWGMWMFSDKCPVTGSSRQRMLRWPSWL